MPARAATARPSYFLVRAPADRRIVLAAVAGGACFDLAARSGIASVAATAWIAVTAAGLMFSRRVRGLAGRIMIGTAPLFALLLTVRASPWVIVPTSFAIVLVLLLGVSHGADNSGLNDTLPALATRIWLVLGHLTFAPGMLRPISEPGSRGIASRRAMAITRGFVLGAPVVLVIGLLLAWADPIFRSWFDLTALFRHLTFAALGAWVVIGLARAASARQPSPRLGSAPKLGAVEAVLILGGMCGLYLAFVAAQFVALSDGGHHVLVTHGLTYAQYARSGFFQLLACAAITLIVLLAVRACASPDHPAIASLSGLTVALTVGVVIVAIRRLQLYEAVFGLTMLRLACLVAAGWIGAIFLLLGASIPRRGLPRRRYASVVVVSGLVLIGLWGIANPASIVARTNVDRAAHGHRLDLGQVAVLGPDAVPALLTGLDETGPAKANQLRRQLCALYSGGAKRSSGVAAFNLSAASARDDVARTCAP
jgi:hypothetical protein